MGRPRSGLVVPAQLRTPDAMSGKDTNWTEMAPKPLGAYSFEPWGLIPLLSDQARGAMLPVESSLNSRPESQS